MFAKIKYIILMVNEQRFMGYIYQKLKLYENLHIYASVGVKITLFFLLLLYV